MVMKNILLLLLAVCLTQQTFGQLTITNGKHTLELTGAVSTYYNYRSLKENEENNRKNRFKLRDAQIQLEGRVANTWEYELQIDFADLASTERDPENPGIMDAFVTYKGIKWLDITFGFSKTPYARSSQVPFIFSPYWQRAEFLRGDIFSRRDVGITLSKYFWKQRIGLFAGAYTGLGEISLAGDNDPSGKLEYIGRAEFAYPSRYRYRDIDTRLTPIPMFVIGANGRYTNKTLQPGQFFPSFSTGEYDIKVIDGQRDVVGLDASFQFQGFSAQFEIHRMTMRPQNANSALYQGYLATDVQEYVRMGGYYAQANYFIKKLHLILSSRYEQFNLSDLAEGQSKRLNFALAYQLDGFNSMIKCQFFHIMEEESIDPLRWKEQFRIGWQYLFK